jgi:DNA replication protein DnaC
VNRDELIQNLLSRKIADGDFNRIQDSYPVAALCPTCDGKEQYKLNDKWHDCDCQIQKLLQKHYFQANIGREYHDICADIHFEGPDREDVIPVIEDYLKHYTDNFHYGIGVTFSGPVGTGKTFAMTSILKELIKDGRNCYFVGFDELIDVWGRGWHDDTAKKILQDKLKRVEVLGIDELKTDGRNMRGFLAAGFEAVIRHRTSNLLPTLVTTNMTKIEEMAEFSKAYSLLSIRNLRVEFGGHDRRNKDVRPIVHGHARAGERRPIC